jgi:hypothetical protein
MAIEDDDSRERGVDWSRATGKPNVLQQLFYYSKSLDLAVPFSSARGSNPTLFYPVLNADNGKGQYRLPLLDNGCRGTRSSFRKQGNQGSIELAVGGFLVDSTIRLAGSHASSWNKAIISLLQIALLCLGSHHRTIFESKRLAPNNSQIAPSSGYIRKAKYSSTAVL